MSDRYVKQIALAEIGADGQARLAQSRVLCVGAGGLGSPALLYLTAAGIGSVGIIDDDPVDLSNLQRQVLFSTADVGKSKAETAARKLAELNPDITVVAHRGFLDAENAVEIMSGYDIVIDATDNFSAKFLINDAAVKLGIPSVYGAISGFEGQVAVFWGRQGGCYRCLNPRPPRSRVFSCAEAGVIGAVAGVVGTMQAMEAIKLALGTEHCATHGLEPLLGRLMVVDARNWRSSFFSVPKKADCPVCGVPEDSVALDKSSPRCGGAVVEISWKDAAALQKVAYVDVREEYEWLSGHVEGAVHAPLSKLIEKPRPFVEGLGLPRDATLAVYCQHGWRSLEASRILSDLGFKAVSVSGGISAR